VSDKYTDIDVNHEKVRKIVDAAFEEFAKFGKKKASLNNILKSSGLSKGVFYHYFKDKEFLFDFLIHYTIEASFQEYSKRIDWDDGDIIRRVCEISKVKLEIIKKHPYLIEFGERYREHYLESTNLEYFREFRHRFYSENIDDKMFRNQGEIKAVIHIISWTYKGLFINLTSSGDYMDEKVISALMDQCEHYYHVLAKNFYS